MFPIGEETVEPWLFVFVVVVLVGMLWWLSRLVRGFEGRLAALESSLLSSRLQQEKRAAETPEGGEVERLGSALDRPENEADKDRTFVEPAGLRRLQR